MDSPVPITERVKEEWNTGKMECWKDEMLERWNFPVREKAGGTPPSLEPKFRVVGSAKFHAVEFFPRDMAIQVADIASCGNRAIHVRGQVI